MVLWCCPVLSGAGQLTPGLLMCIVILSPVLDLPDPTGRSECLGQSMVGLDLCQGVQGQMLQGPDLGVGPGPDLDRTYYFLFMLVCHDSLRICP